MSQRRQQGNRNARVLLWVARLAGTAVVTLLMLMVVTESGSGPGGIREWMYLAFFPFGFSAGYLLGWRRPLQGGYVSLACMALSLVVIGRAFPLQAYVIWVILSVPGVLYVVAGSMLPSAARQPGARAA